MNRFYQISLRTVFELIFVTAVVFAFLYWRSQPPPESAGRYQLTVTQGQFGGGPMAVFLDTKTGKAWQGRTGSDNWRSIPTPADPFRLPTPPATPATAAGRWSGPRTGESSGSDSEASSKQTRHGCF